MPSSRAGREGGFTLIEMIVVLVVLGLVAGLVISRGPQRSATIEARSAATRLLQGLRATRAEAIALNRPVLFGVDGGRHLYQVGTDVPQPIPKQVTVSVLVGSRHARGIMFNPDGSSQGGRILLADAAQHLTVTVDWLSGGISAAVATP